MKVGTDGVLLGAWASTERCQRILDVGTGTGLIALMLAQRSTAILDAIDIDSDACLQAQENIAKSPFANRIQVYQTSLSEYMPDENIKYDLIVSNPPYFIDSLKCPDTKRNLARILYHSRIYCVIAANCWHPKEISPWCFPSSNGSL